MVEPSTIEAAVFSDCGQLSTGPNGVAAQSSPARPRRGPPDGWAARRSG